MILENMSTLANELRDLPWNRGDGIFIGMR